MKKSLLKPLLISGIMIMVSFYTFYGAKISPKIDLRKVVANSLIGTKGTYGIIIKNLKTEESYSINSHRVYKTGSLYKLWVMSAAFEQIQNGKLSEDEALTGDIEDLNEKFDIDPNARELTGGTVSLTVGSALRQMITISHNYGALLLIEKIGLSNVKLFLEKHGLKESIIGEDLPTSTANDIELFLEKLYKGELANEKYSNKMLKLLKMQKLNNKLPKYLPKDVVVAHKTGEIGFLTHDAGIAYTKNGDYIIVIFSESDNPKGAEE